MTQFLESTKAILALLPNTPTPETIFAVAIRVANVLPEKKEVLTKIVPLVEHDQITLCSAVALALSCGSSLEDSDGFCLVAKIFSFLKAPHLREEEVLCAAIALSKCFPRWGTIEGTNDALKCLCSISDDGMFSLTTSIEIVSQTTFAIIHGETIEDKVAHVRTIITAILRCFSLEHRDENIIPVLTRKVLIPLLQSSVQVANEFHTPIFSLVKDLAASNHLSEAVVLIAALFDFFFPVEYAKMAPKTSHDLRKEDVLWDVIVGSLRRFSESGEDVSRAATLHLQAVYLLKRIVDFSSRSSRNKGASMLETFHKLFLWSPTLSESLWNDFFLVFETLSEYGIHLIVPAMKKLDRLFSNPSVISSCWCEVLLHKALVHANVGVRKLGLRYIFSLPTMNAVDLLSETFLWKTTFLATADPRICSEPDRVVLPGSFLDCKAFGDRTEKSMPIVLPLAYRIEKFYCDLVVALPNEHSRKEAVKMLLGSIMSVKSPRFGLCIILRILIFLAPLNLAIADEEILAKLSTFVVELIQNRHPQWLETRLTAMVFDAAVALCGTSDLLASTFEFHRLVALCGQAGDSGGRSMSSIDASGVAGSVGAALPTFILANRIRQLHEKSPVIARFVESLNLPDKIQHLFNSGKLDFFGGKSIANAAAFCGNEAQGQVVSLVSYELLKMPGRTYQPFYQKLAIFHLAAELGVSLEGGQAQLWSPEVTRTMWEELVLLTQSTLDNATQAVSTTFSLDDFDKADCWSASACECWDVVCAAITQSAVCGRGVLDAKMVLELVQFSVDILTQLSSVNSNGNTASEFAVIVLSRNAAKVIHAVFTASASSAGLLSSALSPSFALDLFKQIANLPVPHLTVSPVPCSLISDNWGSVIAQYSRYIWNSCFALCDFLGSSTDVADEVVQLVSSHVDKSSASNMSCLFDILTWASQFCSDYVAAVETMMSQLHGGIRREMFRCIALACCSTCSMRNRKFVHDTLAELTRCEMENDRTIYFVALSLCTAILSDSSCYPDFLDLLVHIAVFCNSAFNDEDELEACLAVCEPLLESWEENLRASFPPAIRMISVAKSMCVATILFLCSQDEFTTVNTVTYLLKLTEENKILVKEPCMPNSLTHRSRIRIWQLLAALGPTIPPSHWPVVIEKLVTKSVPQTNPGSVRRFIELILILGFSRHPESYPILDKELAKFAIRPQVAGSLTLVAIHLVLGWQFQMPQIYEALFPKLARMCSSHQHLLRILTHIGVEKIVVERKKKGFEPSTEIAELVDYVLKSPESTKFREKHYSVVVFDINEALSPEQIFCVQRTEGEVWLLESVPCSTFERIRHTVTELNCVLGCVTPFERYRCEKIAGFMNAQVFNVFKDFPLIPHCGNRCDSFLNYAAEAVVSFGALQFGASEVSQEQENMQRKVASYWNSEIHNELHPRGLDLKKRHSIVVVTTLLDNPVNVAGLCRCSEIFAVEKLVIADRKVFQHPHFIAAARSAELWIPWEEVPKTSLEMYLSRMRRDSYRIVGVEQTSDSEVLDKYHFPEKVVMILGSEGQGIPPDVLPWLDVCVEIPQFGLIRSLNVHVTGAIVLYEFLKQHGMTS